MSSTPLVSVAIVTYNQLEFAKKCIDSVLEQDYNNIEIIVADDGSVDGTQDLLKEYYKSHPDKFVLKLSGHNKGITANSNSAFFSCKGKYISWMGGDDIMLPGKISKQVGYMEKNPKCAISYHNLEVFNSETGEVISEFNKKNKITGSVLSSIEYGPFNGACSTMVRAKDTPSDGFDVAVPVASDWLFWVETLVNGGTIDYIDEILGRYRRHSGNVTNIQSKISQNEIDHLVSCQLIIARYPQFFPQAIKAYSSKILGLRHKLNYRQSLWRSFLISPNLKALAGLALFFITFGKVRA